MNASDQLLIFEPEASKLAELVGTYIRNAEFEERRSQLLALSGYRSAAGMCFRSASVLRDHAAVCEMALQFEQLACLS